MCTYIYIFRYLSIFGVDINLWLRAFAADSTPLAHHKHNVWLQLRGELPSHIRFSGSRGTY